MDSARLLEKGKLIEIRPHTRFVHFPRHRHNYVELIYMCSGSTTHIINGTQKVVLQTGDLLFLNQAVYHEILPAAQDDVAVNFIILPQFFDRSFAMLQQENVLRDFLVSTLSGESAFAGYLHIRAHDILPVHNLLENMIWTLLENKRGVNDLNETTMGLLLLNLSLFAQDINQAGPRPHGREHRLCGAAIHRSPLPGRHPGRRGRSGAPARLHRQPSADPPHRPEFPPAAPAAQAAAGGLPAEPYPSAGGDHPGEHRLREQQLFLPPLPGPIRLFPLPNTGQAGQSKRNTCSSLGCAPVSGSISSSRISFMYSFQRATTGLSACTFSA